MAYPVSQPPASGGGGLVSLQGGCWKAVVGGLASSTTTGIPSECFELILVLCLSSITEQVSLQ